MRSCATLSHVDITPFWPLPLDFNYSHPCLASLPPDIFWTLWKEEDEGKASSSAENRMQRGFIWLRGRYSMLLA